MDSGREEEAAPAPKEFALCMLTSEGGAVTVLEDLLDEVESSSELASAFSAMVRGGAGALLTLADPVFGTDPPRLARLAAENRLPAMFFEKVFVDAGGLMSFGPNIPDQFRRAAAYVDKILKGTKPADIPVEQPTRFNLAINMETAKTLGIAFPTSILIQATEVVQ